MIILYSKNTKIDQSHLSKKFISIEALNNPRKLAAKIISEINDHNVTKLEIAGPSFINIFLRLIRF